ncbi:hypothetical protein [Dankookia sp. P2]|uniref:hypothetical protein n=1 Tax=Dankookia sp. P2 TaxID=3423955 RepID=UPI003D67F9C9
MLQAFWRGELEATLPGVAGARDSDPRVRVLNSCRHTPQDAGLVVVDRPEDLPPADAIEQPDGSAVVDLRRRVVWPADPTRQTPELLATACAVLAEAEWDDYHDLTKPVLAMLEVGRDAFGTFRSEAGFTLPPFWFKPDTQPATVQAQNACRLWLRAKVAAGDKQYGKAGYFREAKRRSRGSPCAPSMTPGPRRPRPVGAKRVPWRRHRNRVSDIGLPAANPRPAWL